MNVHRRRPFDPVGGTETPESVVLNRRRFLKGVAWATGGAATVAGAGYAAFRVYRGSDEEVLARGQTKSSIVPVDSFYPAPRDDRFEYGRHETLEAEAARYANFYEFTSGKAVWRYVDGFETDPWSLTIDGLCERPLKLDIDELLTKYAAERVERQYRHRCVETWAMAVPWTGIPLSRVLADVIPLAEAKFVRFQSFHKPEQASGVAGNLSFPWPYAEGLTLAEATNDLTLLATGMYGHPLLKQHGAPLRLVVPWKYGYKSIKSIVRIELVRDRPATFWNTLVPEAYPFESNVEPHVARPWAQNVEEMLGTGEMRPTELYNGYGEYVAHLYRHEA